MTRSRIPKPRKKYIRKSKQKKPFDPFHLVDNATFIMNIKAMGFNMIGFVKQRRKREITHEKI